MSAEQPVNFIEAMQLAKKRESEPRQQLVVADGPQAGGSSNAWSEAINNPKDADAVQRTANARAANSWFAGLDASKRAEAAKKAESANAADASLIHPNVVDTSDASLVQVRA